MSKTSNLSKMQTVSRKAMIRTVAVRTDTTLETSQEIISMFLNEIIEELAKGNRIEFRGFGVFDTYMHKGSEYTFNPRTLERAEGFPPYIKARFKPRGILRKLNETDTNESV